MGTHAFEHSDIQAGEVRLHVVQAGPVDGKPLILLHGFPDFWMGWRHQIGALAEAGFRVIVPDQRGYNTSDRPSAITDYEISRLVGDVVGLADALGHHRFSLVGHDWGGIVAWAAGSLVAERLDRLVILNAPHPDVFGPYVRRSPSQMLRSSYVGFFQIPWLPEMVLGAGNCAALVAALKASARQDALTEDDIARYRQAWQQPGSLTGMLNWYRALRLRRPLEEVITTRTLVLWGLKDTALEVGLAEKSLALCTQGRLQTFDGATHWLQREEPDAVNAAILGFLAS
jgi:pimeloyl-ACP methyl ester carboxylesterase